MDLKIYNQPFFSFFSFFACMCLCFFFFFFWNKILIQFRPYELVSDKNNFHPADFRKQDYFFLGLQITFSLLRNWNNRINDAWGDFFWKSISMNEIFSFWKLKISFTDVSWKLKQFNWNLMLRYTVKLTLN